MSFHLIHKPAGIFEYRKYRNLITKKELNYSFTEIQQKYQPTNPLSLLKTFAVRAFSEIVEREKRGFIIDIYRTFQLQNFSQNYIILYLGAVVERWVSANSGSIFNPVF